MVHGFYDDKSKFDLRVISPGDSIEFPPEYCFGGVFDGINEVVATIPLNRIVDKRVRMASIDNAYFMVSTHDGYAIVNESSMTDRYIRYDRASNSIHISFASDRLSSLYLMNGPVMIKVMGFKIIFS